MAWNRVGTDLATHAGVVDAGTAKPVVGMQVSDYLTLERRLGGGAMASVWRAEHRTLGIARAVKFLAPALAADDGVAERFEREARTIARIRCPHVVEVFDYGRLEGGAPFIVTELLEGEDLADHITRVETMTLEEAAVLVEHVGAALQSAHDLGIVHRDLKPANIFVTEGEEGPVYKVLDFGIAKESEGPREERTTITETGASMGTPGFMSPEQWLNAKSVDAKSDLWALGAVMYCAVTNEIPFDGPTPAQAFLRTCSGELPPASDYCPDIPEELDAWFDKALARHADDRFDSAAEMVKAFVDIVAAYEPRLSFSDRPTCMLPGRVTPDPKAALIESKQTSDKADASIAHDGGVRDDASEDSTPSLAPVAMVAPPALAAEQRERYRRRAGLVTTTVMAALAVMGLSGAVGVATMHQRTAAAAQASFQPELLDSRVVCGVAADTRVHD